MNETNPPNGSKGRILANPALEFLRLPQRKSCRIFSSADTVSSIRPALTLHAATWSRQREDEQGPQRGHQDAQIRLERGARSRKGVQLGSWHDL